MKTPGLRAFHMPRRRSTAPELHTPESPIAASRPPKTTASDHLQGSGLPPIERRSLKKFRKYYIANLSSKNGSTQDQAIISGAYFQSEGPDLKSIRLETLGSNSGARGALILESPRPQKGGLSMPRVFRTISQSNAMKSIGNMVPIAPNLGHFRSIPFETPDEQAHPVLSATLLESITYQTPLPLDNLIVLASKISSRRLRRSLHSPTRSWFIQAMWEGLKRLQSLDSTPPVDLGASSSPDSSDTPADIRALVDKVMQTFGGSLLLFHHKVLKIQQKRDHSMSASQEQQQIVRQEIAERNEDISRTQANWHVVEQESEALRRRESLLRKHISRNMTAY
ncbi:unnamed protein product [Rhizoctonia solani]|uniref:Uncharacterized protein n=1 Tax=Rhizoctonia solani TaxID=456999 RepID=A0A8H2WR07_9AGAM|nr:unnamed protein product [Rhizoctonia solani]